MKPPLAASTWMPISQPFDSFRRCKTLWIPWTSSKSPVKVEPRIGHTPMVFSSQCGATRSGVKYSSSSDTSASRASTSKYMQALCQQHCTLLPKTKFGLLVSRPAALRALRQRARIASTANMIASELPTHAVPVILPSSPGFAYHILPIMLTQRWWIAADCGYSSISIMLTRAPCRISFSASGSMYVVTKDARFCGAFPSSRSSSSTSCWAQGAAMPCSGISLSGSSWMAACVE
mmetsp:Transcript_6352/g.20604  ORF Transcript_6352/g.20604 Transcript_6352/m.20604 type:complete len:234 (+) Transcript_6352:930-1631(+)